MIKQEIVGLKNTISFRVILHVAYWNKNKLMVKYLHIVKSEKMYQMRKIEEDTKCRQLF